MPHGYLEYEFSECLYRRAIEGGWIEAGELNGTAEIEYDRDGRWSITGISLDGWDTIDRKFNARLTVPKGSEVYRILLDRLTTGETAEFIQSEVDEATEEDRQPDPDYEYERRRDDVMEGAR